MESPLPNQSARPSGAPHESSSAPEPDGEWYRLALLLTGDAAAAAAVLEKIFAVAPDELAQLRGRERRRIWLLRQIRVQALQWRQEHEPADSASLPGRVSALPEPARSVFAVFHCAEGGLDDLAELLGLSRAAFAKALAKARAALAPEGVVFPENVLLRVHRPWGGDRAKVAKAVRAVEASPEPAATAPLAAQAAADAQWHAEIEAIAIPEALVALYRAVPPRRGLWGQLFQPAVLAIALALVVVVGALVYLARTRGGDFPGREAIEAMVEAESEASEPPMEAVTPAAAGKLDDWFVLKGFEGYAVPPPMDKVTAIGCRVWKHGNLPVADVALRKVAGVEGARLLVFRVADLPTGTLEPGGWRVFQQDEWAVAVWSDRETVCAVVIQGDSDDMRRLLRTLER
ncbi:MAG: hypothetical protein PHQ12_13310 [Chthoniobacteraceae bacterium]|nr:hypothetical protein [Chthoniobacteraceae bacterium]